MCDSKLKTVLVGGDAGSGSLACAGTLSAVTYVFQLWYCTVIVPGK